MIQKGITYGNGKVMNAPTDLNCMYSAETIEKSEIAVTFKPQRTSLTNQWLKLSSIQPFIEDLSDIVENPEDYYNGDSIEGTDQVEFRSKHYITGSCVQCGEHDRSKDILTLSYKSDPYIHVDCIKDFIDSLKRVSNIVPMDEVIAKSI